MGEEKTWRVRLLETFTELFKSSVIIQGLVTAVLIITICIMVLWGREVPKELWLLTGTVVGYWFGAKNNLTIQKIVETQAQAVDRLCAQLARGPPFPPT